MTKTHHFVHFGNIVFDKRKLISGVGRHRSIVWQQIARYLIFNEQLHQILRQSDLFGQRVRWQFQQLLHLRFDLHNGDGKQCRFELHRTKGFGKTLHIDKLKSKCIQWNIQQILLVAQERLMKLLLWILSQTESFRAANATTRCLCFEVWCRASVRRNRRPTWRQPTI